MRRRALLLLGLYAMPLQPAWADEGERYDACMAIVRQEPERALEQATAWRADGGAVPAMHCQAMALIELGQPARAGAVLDAAREQMQGSTASSPTRQRASALAAMLAAQAGNAWMLAGEPAKARDRLSQAITLYDAQSPYRTEALIDRARAAAELKDWDAAIKDLTEALATAPDRVDALLFRATARRHSGDLDGALTDIAQAATLTPQDADVLYERGAIKAAQGKLDEARADWRQSAQAADSPAAQRALAALKQLDQR